jgi:hypothetical protein
MYNFFELFVIVIYFYEIFYIFSNPFFLSVGEDTTDKEKILVRIARFNKYEIIELFFY